MFLTIYDPAKSTEYQCGVKKVKEGEPEVCELWEYLQKRLPLRLPADNSKDISTDVISVHQFSKILSDAVNDKMLILGPPLTPQLKVSVIIMIIITSSSSSSSSSSLSL